MQQRSTDPAIASSTDRADCKELLRGGSRTFYAASLALPSGVREPATALYAFCRLADDAVDLGGGMPALEQLRERLDKIYAGRPYSIPADCAFADVVAHFSIPRTLPEALLEGIEWDVQGRRYENIEQLREYAARVAGSVGAMMSILMGAREPAVLARACDLGVAMQLTNIARDVGEDARNGRIYLPLQLMRAEGVDPDAWLMQPVFSEAIGNVTQRLLRAADELYVRAGTGVSKLPLSCQPGMHAARLLYAEIGREVERRGLDSVSGRAVVPASRKAWLLVGALATTLITRASSAMPALPETRYLVDAAATVLLRSGEPEFDAQFVPWWNFYERVVWVIQLFEQLEQRDQRQQLRFVVAREGANTALG